MNYRYLGRTGIQVSEICLGSMLFGTDVDAATAQDMIAMALDHGVNFLDTADIYGRGKSEAVIGNALAVNKQRDRLILASKVHVQMDPADPNSGGNSRRHIIEGCEASLRRLKTDYLDLYYIHRPSTLVPIDETLRALDDLVRAGKVRHIGTSSFAAWQVLESLWVSKEYGLNRFVVEQSPYHLLDRRIEREMLPMARTYGIGVTLWSPLAGGFLSGKYRRNQAPPPDSRLSDTTSEWSQKHFRPAAFDVAECLLQLAEEKNALPVQIALAWGLAREGVSSTVIGVRDAAQLAEQLGTVNVSITPSDLARLDEVARPGDVITPYYLDDDFADFRPHRHRW